MTAVDGVYWALALAIVIIAAGLTWFIVRGAGTLGRFNQILGDVREEVPAIAASVRQVIGNVEKVTSDVAEATSVLQEGAATVRLVVDRIRSLVAFLDEHIFSKLAALAPLFAVVGGWIERLTTGKRGRAATSEAVEDSTGESTD